MKNILIIGATSAMAEHVARLYAQQGDRLYLLARNEQKLQPIVSDLIARGASQVEMAIMDAADLPSHQSVLDHVFSTFNTIDVVLIAHGSLPDQAVCEKDVTVALSELEINGTSYISLLTIIAEKMEQQGRGTIAAITSVAGDRGRQSNYVYGAAKGMVSIFLQGLSQRLSKQNIHVLDIKPGFVDTPMTADFPKGPLWAKPESVAEIIKSRIDRQSSFSYVPSFWFFIMTVIKTIPKFIFNKLNL